jgi:hypothetical protein
MLTLLLRRRLSQSWRSPYGISPDHFSMAGYLLRRLSEPKFQPSSQTAPQPMPQAIPNTNRPTQAGLSTPVQQPLAHRPMPPDQAGHQDPQLFNHLSPPPTRTPPRPYSCTFGSLGPRCQTSRNTCTSRLPPPRMSLPTRVAHQPNRGP